MSKENVALFFEKMKADNELKQQLYRLSGDSHEELLEKTIEFAVKNGYEFSREEMEQVAEGMLMGNDELSDEDMEAVAGGAEGVHRFMLKFNFSLLAAVVGCAASAIHNSVEADECKLPGWGK